MGSYNTAVITTAGQALLTSILANQGTLTFSKFQTSSYQYASGTDLSALTSLNDVEQTVTPSGAGIIDSTTLYATSTVSNSGLAAEYTAYTLGLFISDGVDEVLFAVATAIVPDVIPEDIGGTPSTYTYSLQLGVSSTEDITINVDMDAYLTADSVIDNLTSSSVNSPLSANQGKELNDNKAERTDISSIITTGTKNTTGAQIARGTYFYLNGELVKAKSLIDVNDDYTLNTNYEVVTVGGVLTELNSNLAKVINNGEITKGHLYAVLLEETSIAQAMFEVLFSPNDNSGRQTFGICLSNGTNIFACTGKISFSNGTLSLSDCYRRETGINGIDSWSVSIRLIRRIA